MADLSEGAAATLHRLTSYRPDLEWTDPVADKRIVQTLEVNDLDRWPWPYKHYDDALPRLELPREFAATTPPLTAVLAGVADVPAASIDVAGLARLLYLTAGVVRIAERPGRQILFRAAGSAGARFPLEVYVAVPDGGALPAGVHWYDPHAHGLVRIADAPRGTAPTLVMTGVPWRTGWRYRERGYRHIYWDAGTALAQLVALADSAGVPADLYTRFPDDAVTELVGADGVHEFPVAVVALGAGTPTVQPHGTATAGGVDHDPLEFPLVTATQHAGDGDAVGTAWPRGDAVRLEDRGGENVEAVIRRRGSQRRMDPSRGVPRETLTSCMAVAMRGIDVTHWVAVHDVECTVAGLYRWPDLDRPLREGNLRDELYTVCMEQGLGKDAAFVVVSTADVATLDARGYREAQFAAGLVEGRLHLIAYALGASASGMTFYDSAIPTLVGEPADGLLITCVGVPEYTSRAAGEPGNPSTVRIVSPR